MKNGNVICLFAKYPAPGKVKDRLEKVVGKKQAAFLARAFLLDTISTSLRVPRADLYLAHSPSDSGKDFENLLYLFAAVEKDNKIARKAGLITLIPQSDGDLGSRLKMASEFFFSNGARRVVFLGSDCPLLQPVVLRASFELLKKNQVIVGPTFDGRYYLIGIAGHFPEMFEGIDWSASSVYRETVSRLSKNGLEWQELELSYDVDGPEELEQLYSDIDNLRLAGENNIAYHTEKCLQNLVKIT